ncbi:16552_t:CDS:2, partial [Acaulospora morrowiae]
VLNVHDYFLKQMASTWCLQNYLKFILDNLEEELVDFDQAYSLFVENLELINQTACVPLPVKSFCKHYLIWLKSSAGVATIEVCRNYINNKKPKPPKTPLQTRRLKDLISPEKRPLENQELQNYSKEISVICAFGMNTEKLIKEIGEELFGKLSSVHYENPSIWTPALEQYIDTTLMKTGNDFREAVLHRVSDVGNELFKMYCEKVLLD